MDKYVSKPVSAGELFDVVGRLISARGVTNAPVAGHEGAGQGEAGRGEGRSRALNREKLLAGAAGDLQLLRGLVDISLRELPALMSAVSAAALEGDAVKLTLAAHKLKGSAATLYADRAFDAALRLETIAREGNISQSEGALGVLKEEVDVLCAALRQI
jgi:HPt (histidine-containing phosphotransfer) domain-containing protein